ncbi:MAG TPA: hypothetical protein DF383_02905 [Deltaproteobacteria bacterium]|nr:hypothetical protein [Deltaproteobacteria bacterium]
MSTENHRWAIVLAAGEGTRLRSLTTDAVGTSIPKQFCSFQRPHSMLRDAVLRARRHVLPEHILVIVSTLHRLWWKPQLADFPEENIVEQPESRGTAAGVLLPLIEILRRDPEAEIFLLPSDHFVKKENVLEHAAAAAFPAAHEAFQRVVLLGMMPEHPDPDFGWIVPRLRGREMIPGVEAFVEKPEPSIAKRLFQTGGLWNSFILAASGKTLLFLFQEKLPDLLAPVLPRIFQSGGRWNPRELAAVYERLPSYDFSKNLLERAVSRLGVMPVPPCGWSDLGTPERVRRCLIRSGENWDVDYYSKFLGRPILLPHVEDSRTGPDL